MANLKTVHIDQLEPRINELMNKYENLVLMEMLITILLDTPYNPPSVGDFV